MSVSPTTTSYAQHSTSVYTVYGFTATGTGDTVDLTVFPMKSFSMQVTGTGGTPTLWTAILEGSLDGTNFDTILTHTNVVGINVVMSTGSAFTTMRYIRPRVTVLTLGGASAANVHIAGVSW